MARYYVGKSRHPVTVEKEDVIGSGGEAVIFGANGKVLKIYHQPDARRSKKLDYFFGKNLILPENIIAPEEPVFATASNAIVGFQMRLLPNSEPLAMLMRQDYCDSHGITARKKVEIFTDMLRGLQSIHQSGLVVGDCNDQNERFNDQGNVTYWIDVDSWQMGSFPCMVGTEEYLSPELYGIDLSRQPQFKPEHDYYSFAVLFFRALMMAHPFGSGFCRKYVSLFDRAKHGLTILDSDVRYPNKAKPREVLTDEIADLLLNHLKRKAKGEFPLKELKNYAELLVECRSCHLWYPASRTNCPGCTTKTIVAAKIATKIAGCVCEIILETPGKILYTQFVEKTFYCLTDENDITVLYKKNPSRPLERFPILATTPGATYAFFDDTLVVCTDPTNENPTLYLADVSGPNAKAITTTTTNKFNGGSVVFGSSGRRLYRLSGSSLMSGSLFDTSLADRQVMQIIPNQTWFTVATNPELTESKEVVFGCQRIFDEYRWFLSVGDTEGRVYKNFSVDLPPLAKLESIVDLSVRFGKTNVLVLRNTRLQGISFVRIDRVKIEDGSVVSSRQIKTADAKQYDTIHGKGYTDDGILHATEDGISIESVKDGKTAVLPGTANYINGNEQLFRFEMGVVSVSSDRVLFLSPEK